MHSLQWPKGVEHLAQFSGQSWQLPSFMYCREVQNTQLLSFYAPLQAHARFVEAIEKFG